jgi:protoporphyrinogen oxidase
MASSELIVIGAGPAGLVAALEAARAGRRCTVVEASDRIGGMAASIEVGGQRVDLGSHRLHPAAPPRILALAHQLLGEDLQVRRRKGRIRLADRWIGFPLRAADLVRHLPPTLAARLALDTATSRFRNGPDDSFDAVVRRRFGPTVAETFYHPYALKLYGRPPAELDAELAQRRIAATSGAAVLRRVVGAARGGGPTFLYPRLGFGQLVERLADAAADAGVELVLDTPVDRIASGPAAGSGMEVRSGRWRRAAEVVLATLPVTTLAGMVDPPPPEEVAAAAGRLRTRAVLLVYLVVDRPRYTPFDAHYLPGPETVIARLSESKNYRDGPDRADRTVLCAEIPCWTDDELWAWEPAELGALVSDQLLALGLPKAEPVDVVVRRLRSVYPVLERATAEDRATVGAWAADLDGIITFGRQGLAVPDNVHHVLDMGLAAARAVTGEQPLDRTRWLHDLDRFAGHVVED